MFYELIAFFFYFPKLYVFTDWINSITYNNKKKSLLTHTIILHYTYGTNRGKQHQTKGKQKYELDHQTKDVLTKCKKGKKIKQKNRTQNKLDLEIPKLNHQASVNIYILWGEEVRKEGRRRGCQ